MLAQAIGPFEVSLVVLYLAVVAYLGWLGYRRTQNATDYLIAGRKAHPFIMALSYGSTFISTSAIVGFGGVAGLFGMSVLWLTFFNIFVGIFIAFVVLGGPVRRMGHRLDAHTFPEFLGRRYDSRFIQVFAGLIIFCFMPVYAAAVIIGGTEFITAAFKIDYHVAVLVLSSIVAVYVLAGGLKGVMYTDALQGGIMFVGMGVLLVSAYWIVGGIRQGHADLTAMADQVFVGFKAIGHRGWTALPAFGWGKPAGLPADAPSPYDLWYIVFTTIVLGVGIGVLAQPQLVVRFMTVKSKRELNRAVLTGGFFILMMTGVAFTVGALSNVYFYKHEKIVGRIVGVTERADVIVKKERDVEKRLPCKLLHVDTVDDNEPDFHVIAEGLDAAAAILPKAEIRDLGDGRVEILPKATSFTRALVRKGNDWMLNPDSIIPNYVTSSMPKWFGILFLLTLLAAAMSTISSQFHTAGTALGRDVIQQLFHRGDAGGHGTHVVRLGMIVGIVVAVIFSYYARGGYIVARATAIFFGLCAAAFLPSLIGGLFFKRMTRVAAICSMVTGFVISGFWVLFVKASEAGAIGIVQRVTGGKNSILVDYPNWPVVEPIVIALPISALVAAVVSLLTRPPSDAHLERCFGGAKAAPAPAPQPVEVTA
ncbi:MAG TPA: sodium:solute symporter family protein [Phycisphaerae bacterium]|nr:sodium:solute symporter family protein [Phycisphaerae bacterium]HOJ73022.1 sodium:solute symporter family protein [Phycisphaerae bacterium]HOM50206.1 sodium:solute symporter family protein [Phycisphaerae bacterium]HON65034.1 sodium:solute symporter family protein [Phycisphaerae bacterium]HOQ86799.1 sodium:solute symporter family protein [Phycisphaerae bacterium]